MTENERIKNAFKEIFDNYDCSYEISDLEAFPHDVQMHIADVYYKRPFDEDKPNTYDMSRELDREIFKAININDFKRIIGADELRQNGIEITDIKAKTPIGNDFFFAEPDMSNDDINDSFGEAIKEISFRNANDESVTFTSYTDLKKALDNPDNNFFHVPIQSTPIKDFSSAGAEKLREMTENNKMYIDFLKFQGRVFKHNTSVALEFFAQRTETKFIATREQWRKSGRTVAQGSEAIRFVDSNGKNTDFYDFSQVEENVPPYQWMINKNNANEIKKHLGLPEATPIISGVINSTVKPAHITSCMSALGISPKYYREFSKSYLNAIQLVIAGRLETGGNNFNIPSDLTALQMLKTDSQKLAFLTYAANTAREALMKIENAAKNVIAEERIEKNDLREMENPDTTRTEERSGRRTPDNTAGNVGEQSDRSQSNENGRGSGLGDNTESTERQEHEMVSGVQNENGGQSGVLVQVQPDMRTVQPESDGLRTVDGGRTDRDLRNEMDGLHGGELSASGGRNEAVSQVSDSSPFGEQQGGELQGLTGRPVRRDEPTPDGLRGSAEMGTGENVLLGQHGDEGNNFSSGDGSIDEKLNTVFSTEETEKTSTEKADVFVIDDEISDEETLVHITAEIAEKEKQFTDLVNAPERRYDLISDTAKEIHELQKIKSRLKEKIQEKPITIEDIQTLRDIRPVRKSVQNMLEHEVAQTAKLEKLLHSEMGNKSPYEQRKNNNDWRKDDSKSIQITEIQPKDLPKKINDVRQKDNIKKIERGTFINSDTNMEIVFGKKAVDEIIAKAIQDDKRNVPVEARIAALYQMQELVECAVCFDSQVSEYDPVTSKNKSPNTLFMHQMYGIMKYKDESYLAKLSVEEMYTTDKDDNFNGTSNRIYNVRNIKITPIEANRAFDPAVDNMNVTEDTSTSVFISIPQLYEIVKTYDKNFFENPDSVGRYEREVELYLQAEYKDAVAETAGNSTRSEKSELLETVAESRKITKEKAEEVLQQSAEKLAIKRPVTLSERKKILNDFAERNGLGKIQIWKKTGIPSSYRIAETENGDRLFNEQLCTLGKGEVLTAEKLRKSIDEFEKSEFFVQYKQTKSENKSVVTEEPAPETKVVNQPEYPFVSVKAGWNYDKYISPELKEKNYTVPEFNEALKKLSERWDDEEYETKSAFVTLTIHISETESFEKRLNAEYQFEKLSERLEFDDDIFDTEVKLRQAVHEAENHATIPELTEKEKAFLNGDIVEFIAKSVVDADNINKHSDIIQRVQNGEDIHKEFVISLLENQHNFVTTQNNEFTVEYGENSVSAKYGNATREISYKDLGNTFLALIEKEYSDILNEPYDDFSDIDTTSIRESLEETSDNSPFIQQVIADVERINKMFEMSEQNETISDIPEEEQAEITGQMSLWSESENTPEDNWRMYVIPDMRSWIDKSLENTPIEYYDTFEEAKVRFDELRKQSYNNDSTINPNTDRPYSRLVLGIDKPNAAYDILHVIDGQNYLIDDFTRDSNQIIDDEAKEILSKTASEIRFDKVRCYQKLENGSYKNTPDDILFNEWNNAYFDVLVSENISENEKQKPVPEPTEKKKTTYSEKLYKQFSKMFPDIVSGEHTYERYGNVGDAYEPLTVEHLGGNTYAFMTYFMQNGDVMRDPDFEFELDHENKTLNILEYQQDGTVFGTIYQRVYDENNNPDLKLLSSLEKNFMQNLKNAQNMERPLTSYTDKNGNEFNSDNESETIETEEPEINDKSPELRAVLNEFSEKYGLGELNVEPSNYNGYNWKLTEKFQDGTDFVLGEIDSPEYGKPFTPEELRISLKKFENEIQSRGQDISELYNRKSDSANHGGISALPKVQEDLPEITYASRPSEKISNNISAIREMIRLENAEKSGEELYDKRSNQYNSKQASEYRLRQYCGWGGLSQVFDERFKQYNYSRQELHSLLTPKEYAEAKASSLNSHYTPQIIIDAMYKAVQNMDLPRDAKILEPACGTGNFISRIPHSFGNAEVTGVELDSITARIAHQINRDNENVQIINSGFENSGLENESFDLAIGNVPFGDYNMNDPDYVQDWRIHDAFFRKALDKVASGGVVAFVTSTGTMDKVNPKIREYLATQAELIGAVRLPNNAFSDAGTGVPSDIIFLKKRENPLPAHEPKPDWCYTIPDKNGLKINSYFVQNPQMILGEMKKTTFQDRLTCEPFEGANLEKQLNEAIKNLNAKITVAKREKVVNEQRGKVEPWGKNFTFQVRDEKVYYRKGGQMDEIKCTPTEKEMIKKLCEIRDVTRQLIDLQKTSVQDSELVPIREKLNKLYDEYRSEHGELSSKQVKKLFSNDSDFPILQSLENHNKESGKTEKADIFFRRTVNPMLEIKAVESVEEALQISLDRKGKPDISYMAILLDQPPEKVCSELLEKEQIFIDPEKVLPDKPFSGVVERSEYLSGNVRMKLTIAEEYTKTNPEYNQNIDALKTVIPEDIKAEEISVQMGCSWIEPEDYTEFLEHLSGRTSYNSRRCDVSYSSVTGEFSVLNAGSKQSLNLNETTTYGTADYNMYQLAEKIMNQRRIVVQREKVSHKDPSKTVTRTDPKATKVALEKAKLIRAEFEKWIFADEKRKAKYERKYNDIFNSIVGRNYDGSHLTFAGMTNDFTLRPHQKNCVARAIYGGNTLAAHVVGAGKSAVIFTSVMKKKELGLINKACVVVPKALTEQTANEWRKVYPDAKILTVTNDDLSNETKRNLFTAKVATGSYDAVILSQEQFEKIPMSKAYRAEFIQKELDSLEDMLREKKLQNNGKKDYSVKAIEKSKKQLQAKLEKLLNPKSASKAKDDLLEFEQLGFDYLVCDEAHAYKNGFVTTKMTNVSGVTTRPSGRAEDMQMKTDYFNEQFGQGHILFATGTPVSNSMTELYVMTIYLRPDLLKQAGIERFDDWAATFGNVVTKNQQTADGTLKMKTSFASFANLPELMAMYKEFADVQSADKLNLPRPELKTGKPQIISVPATPEQKMYVRELAERAKAIESGTVEPHEDNHLKITGEARLIGLGNNAVKALYEKRGQELPYDFVDDKNSKVDKCVEKVAEIYNQTNYTKGVQIIFSDIAVNSDNGNFSVYDYLKTELIAKGIPEDEIIFAPKADSKERENIFRDINNSKYRVVIASTGTLGTGANIQQNLCALHHVDVPWKPSDFEQREGRILRQGNQNKEVQIFNYVTEGTLDSYLYQTVTNKARFIAQLMDDKAPARVSEDCDEKVLTYGEIQAAAEGNPDFRRRIEVSNEIAELTMLKNEYVHETAVTKEKIERIPQQIETRKELLSHVQNDRKTSEKIRELALSGATKNPDYVVMTREKVNAHLLKMAQEKLTNPEKEIPSVNINNFEISVYFDKQNDEVCFQVKGESIYSCVAGTAENQDNYQRISNLFEKGIPKKEQEIMKEISALEENLEQAKERVDKPFSHELELAEKIEEFQKLEEKLSGLSVQEDVVFDPEEEPIVETAEEKSAREKIYNVDDDDYQPTEDDDNSRPVRR